MFPLHDDNPTEIVPVVTILLIGMTVAACWLLQGAGLSPEAMAGSVCTLGAIPAEVTASLGGWLDGLARVGQAGGAGAEGTCRLGGLTWEALFTSMFMHGSWMHLIGNLWFLWIFGQRDLP